jgi:hypothetical protein
MSSARMNWFITGASSGIGRALALELARTGHAVALFARSADKLEAVARDVEAAGGKALVLPGDVRDADAVVAAVQKAEAVLGPLDRAAAVAGLATLSPFLEQTAGQARTMIETNTLGTIHLAHAVLPVMTARRRGHLCIVASILGRMGVANMSVYAGSKFALLGFVQGLRAELKGTSVGLTVVCPATVETPFLDKAGRTHLPRQDRFLPRLTPEQVSRAIVRAVEKKKRMVTLPWVARISMRLHELFPATFERVFYWF